MKKILFVIAIFIFVIIAIGLWIFFGADFYKINDPAMSPGYQLNERILLKEATNLQRGQVIAFYSHEEKTDSDRKILLRRVIGIPGDLVEIKKGKVFIATSVEKKPIELEEKYLTLDNQSKTCLTPSGSCASTLDFWGKRYEVPPEKYFVLGDNRKESRDSRHWTQDGQESPFVDQVEIVGIVNFKIWPLF